MLSFDFPIFPRLRTNRLILREFVPSDAKALYTMRINDSLMQYIDRPKPSSIADSEEMIRSFEMGVKTSTSLVWAIALKESPDEHIGSIGFYRTDLSNYRAEVGYMLDAPFWRTGIVSEALIEVMRFAFENLSLHTISANINPANNASRQLLLKHGFQKEAYFKENYYFKGRFLDTETYGIINPNKKVNNLGQDISAEV
ncbi:MAG: N-acetyltransferase [Pedobacter sp.]|nr:MAG: N-acetyltransferase [Pedobacter sp.]